MSPDRICLINMPFAVAEAPSIALEQLKVVLDRGLGGLVTTEVHYLHFDFVNFCGGIENYRRMTSGTARLSGLADWLFRQEAFPGAADNADDYLARFYFDDDEDSKFVREFSSS